MEDYVEAAKNWYNRNAEDFKKRYDGDAGWYFERFEDDFYQARVDFRGQTVLDLGSGPGRHAFQLASVASRVVGIDISEEMFRIAESRKGSRTNVSFEVGDARRLRFADGTFDVVLCAGMFEYQEELHPYLREIFRLLGKNGVLLFSCHGRIFPGAWQARAVAIFRWLVKIKLPAPPRSASTERQFPKAYHGMTALRRTLEASGFTGFEFQGTFFILPSLLFRFTRRRFPAWAERAAAWNRWLGCRAPYKWLAPVRIVKCVKKG